MSPANPKRTLVGPSRFEHGSFKGFSGYFDQCHLLDSGESLSGLWIARYPPCGNERKRVLGVPQKRSRPKLIGTQPRPAHYPRGTESCERILAASLS
jgi:hypothetical protein